MSPPKAGALHAESGLKKGRAGPRPSLAKESARFHGLDENRPLIAGRYLVSMWMTGGMSTLYLATDVSTGKPAVVKTARSSANIPLEASSHSIRNEGNALSRIRHPNVISLRARGRELDSDFIAVEYFRGTDLYWVLDREDRLDWTDAGRLASRMCDALQASHGKGVVHGDIKPENILISTRGLPEAKLLDFGLARFLDSKDRRPKDELFGTLDYMAPEALDPLFCDPRSDIYSLGVVMYEMLTGWNPFYSEDRAETVERILRHDPSPPSSWVEIPSRVDALVLRAMAKDPARRFSSAAELKQSIISCL